MRFVIKGSILFEAEIEAENRAEAKRKFNSHVQAQLTELIRTGTDIDTVIEEIKRVGGFWCEFEDARTTG